MRVAGQRRGISVPGEVLHSQGTVAHYKQGMISMYDTVYSVYYTLYLGKFSENSSLFEIRPVCHPHPPPTYKINTQSTRLAEVLSTSTQSRHLWTVP